MRSDPYGTHSEQQRAAAGWINATTRRRRIREGAGIPFGHHCSACSAWTGSRIDSRALCADLHCATHSAALCDRWRDPVPAHAAPHPTRPAEE